jgi:hypothetical protein
MAGRAVERLAAHRARRGGPAGAAERGGTEHARRQLSYPGALRGVPAGRGRPRLESRPQGKAFPSPTAWTGLNGRKAH